MTCSDDATAEVARRKELFKEVVMGLADAAREDRVTYVEAHIPVVRIRQDDGTITAHPATEVIYIVRVDRDPRPIEEFQNVYGKGS